MIPTREQILSADVEQLNTWCAELIMGYTLHYEQIGFEPTANIGHAFVLLDHLNTTRQWECHASFMPDDLLWQGNNNRYVATVWAYGENRHTRAFEMGGETLPLAIVKACLLAVSYADGGAK